MQSHDRYARVTGLEHVRDVINGVNVISLTGHNSRRFSHTNARNDARSPKKKYLKCVFINMKTE